MATTTVNLSYEGTVQKIYTAISVNWVSNVRNAAVGDTPITYTTSTTSFVPRSTYESGKGGQVGTNTRFFVFFDTSGVGGTITAATLNIRGSTIGTSVDTQPVEATAWGGGGGTSTLGTGDYDAVDFSTTYATALTTWAQNTYNTYTLNATAISDMNTNGYLNVALLTEDYDLKGISPALGGDWFVHIHHRDASNPHYLDITYTPAGYGNDINGVASANIDSVIGVASANISTVIGV